MNVRPETVALLSGAGARLGEKQLIERPRLPLSRRLVIGLCTGAAGLLLPWSVLLATRLPARHLAPHWGLAWAGFDVILAAALLAVAVSAWRRSLWLEGAASAAAALLACDAWFDLLTAATLREVVVAAIEAGAVELPLALLCLTIARRAKAHWLRVLAREPGAAGVGRPHLPLEDGTAA